MWPDVLVNEVEFNNCKSGFLNVMQFRVQYITDLNHVGVRYLTYLICGGLPHFVDDKLKIKGRPGNRTELVILDRQGASPDCITWIM